MDGVVRVALAALTSLTDDAAGNLARLHDAMRRAAAEGAHLVVAPEAFGQGFGAITDDPDHDLAAGWEVDGPELAPVRVWCRELGVGACLPFLERSALGLHSSAVVIDARGEPLAVHRRISAGWRDRRSTSPVYVEGHEPVSFSLRGLRWTVALCGDLFDHPDPWSALGADVVLWPLWRDLDDATWQTEEIPAYAEQTTRWRGTTLLVNADGEGAHGGAVAFRDGQAVASLPMTGPGMLTVDLDAGGAVVAATGREY